MRDTQENILTNPGVMALVSGRDRDVVHSVKIQADRERVFYALSIPEYIETWLRSPNEDELRFVFHSVTEETFRIDLYRANTVQTRIQGFCSVLNLNQIQYAWKITSLVTKTSTVVDMRLLTGPGGCTLGLKHSGFREAAESGWYGQVWRRSLDTLCRLMEK